MRDLQGQPIAFAPNDRPWIDFVTVWGHLRPGGRVRVAERRQLGRRARRSRCARTAPASRRSLLRAEVGHDLPLEVHADVAAALTTKLADKRSVAQAILEAPTPVDAKNAGAFAAIATEYDRPARPASARSSTPTTPTGRRP